MVRYIIKTYYVATEKNENFKGEVKDYYYGSSWRNTDNLPYFNDKYGYKSLGSAKVGLKSHKEQNDRETSYGNWIVTSEIVKVECKDFSNIRN